MQQAIKDKKPSGSRSFSTYTTRRRLEVQSHASSSDHIDAVPQSFALRNQAEEEHHKLQLDAQRVEDNAFDPLFDNTLLGSIPPQPTAGLRYAPVTLPLPRNANLKHRYDPVAEQVTKLMMKDGKLSMAQKVRLSLTLTHTPSPKSNPLTQSQKTDAATSTWPTSSRTSAPPRHPTRAQTAH